jgi:hypothetical protein
VTPAAPVLVNQRTALAILGWTPARFLRFVRAKGVRHVVDRRLIIARVDDVVAALGLADPGEGATAQSAPAWSPEAFRESLLRGARPAGRASS